MLMTRPRRATSSLERLELMEKASHLRREIGDLRYKRQHLVSDIKGKRQKAAELKEKRDALNNEVKQLVTEGKEHLKKRDEFQKKIKELKKKRGKITKEIHPKAHKIRSEKEVRKQLNRAARASADELQNEFKASLKTLFGMELSLREEVIMVEMVMDIQRRYNARKNADTLSTDIHKTWEDIKGIEEKASTVSFKIMSLAADGEKEHQAAMELFDKKNEVSSESQEYHENFVTLLKEIRELSKEIDTLSKNIDNCFKELKPLQRKLDNLRISRREEQRLEKLKTAKDKMETTGKIGLEDLKVLLESKALKFKGDEKKNGKNN